MATKPLRAAIYTRISSDREGTELGVIDQERGCRELAEALGWTLHPTRPVYTDNDRGASTLSRKPRPQYAELVAAVRAGQVDGVLYYSNSRLTRRPMEYAAIEELVKSTGVRLATVKSGHVDLTTADGRMIGGILASIDRAEAERISERVMARQQQHRDAGRPHTTGTRPFGFLPDGTTADPDEAAAIRDAAAMIRNGASLGDVVRHWTTNGVVPVAGGRWSRGTVRRAVTRPRIAGIIEHQGAAVGTFTDAPILTRDVWSDVCAKVSDRASLVRARYGGREHLLSGFLTCGTCGGRMKVSARRDEDGNVRGDSFVSCVKENGGCGHVKRNLAMLDAFVLGAVERRLADVAEHADDDPDDPAAQERARLVAERETVEVKIRTLWEQYETTDLAAEDFVPLTGRLRSRLRELDAAIGEAASVERRKLGDDPLADWETGGLEERRELLAALLDTVIVEPIGKVGPIRARAMVAETTKIVWR